MAARKPSLGSRSFVSTTTSPSGAKRRTLICLPPSSALGRIWQDPDTGNVYETQAQLRTAIRQRHSRILHQFAEMVAEGTLGQHPWERLPVESAQQYERFRIYLTLPPDSKGRGRSLDRAGAQIGVEGNSLRKLAHKFHWTLRCECWDREVVRQEDEAWMEEKRGAARRQARLGARLQNAAARGLDLVAMGAVELSGADIVRMADVGVKLERLAHDQSTSNEASSKEVRFIFPGAKPKWADHSELVTELAQVEVQDAIYTESGPHPLPPAPAPPQEEK